MSITSRRSAGLEIAVTLLALTVGACSEVNAACTAVPDAVALTRLRAVTGSISSPYFSPGDIAEVGPMCNSDDLQTIGSAADFVVVVVYGERNSTRNVAVLADACVAQTITTLDSKLGTSGTAICNDDPAQTGLTAPVSGDDPPLLKFKFPDSDDLKPPAGDGVGIVGPATVVAIKSSDFNANAGGANDPLLEALAGERCPVIGRRAGVLTCADFLFPADVQCKVTVADLHETFSHFTALPPPNDYKTVCHEDLDEDAIDDCEGTAGNFQFATDIDGNLLVPMDWSNILREEADALGNVIGLRKRYARASTTLPNHVRPGRIEIPGDDFLSSWPPVGGFWTQRPEFRALDLPERNNELTLFGTVDQPRSVLRFARRMRASYACQGGTTDGDACRPGQSECDCAQDVVECCVPVTRKYFQCIGGSHDSLPCTGRRQCPDGSCSPDSQTNPSSVFEFSGVPPQLDRDPTSTIEGVCRSGPDKSNSCTSNADCAAGNDICATFRAEAGWLAR